MPLYLPGTQSRCFKASWSQCSRENTLVGSKYRLQGQDRLGYDRPSKAVDWLINKAKNAIAKLDELPE
ncbi:hypothetical protein RJ639_008870 [Escallonia herrerae]|uniref:TCP domain-containing protein n=1 Tax=Escallonia herrerae TaxID=1293975 RepID=A0AA88VSF1_9ASTE|nr:hypothetical protein RJ639_008870 [Escallonia herrerae]